MVALFLCIILVDLLLIFIMIFVESKRPYRVLIWTLAFLVLPIFSFVLYLFFGCGVLNRRKKLNEISKEKSVNVNNLKSNFRLIKKQEKDQERLNNMIFNMNLHKTLVLENENIKIYREGNETFKDIFNEIDKARDCVFISSYIFADDKIGNKLLNLLVKKAKQNVKIVVLYDCVGSKKTKVQFFDKLKKNGGIVLRFFPPKINVNLQINYRNHRKIIVIDNFVSFIGGLNIRDDHLGKNKKLFPWLDTHLKIVGLTGLELLKVILSDMKLSASRSDLEKIKLLFNSDFFDKICEKLEKKLIKYDKNNSIALSKKNDKYNKNKFKVQVLNSSCLYLSQKIEESFINLINSAKKEIIIETPYLILDDKIFYALKNASIRGIKIVVIISKKPDKNFVYNASLYFANELMRQGVQIFLFNGFVHSKTMLVDKKNFVCGSANFDMRSFNLNFETSVLVYSDKIAKNFFGEILKTLKESEKLEENFFKKLPVSKKLAIKFSKLFSPIL